MRRVLRHENARLLARTIGDRLGTRKCWWIKIVPEIKTHRTDRCLIADPDPGRMRDIAIITLAGSALVQAELRVFLAPAQQVVQHIPAIGEDISSVFENNEAHVVLYIGQSRWWKTQFQMVKKKRAPANGKPGYRVARTCLV